MSGNFFLRLRNGEHFMLLKLGKGEKRETLRQKGGTETGWQ